MATAGVTFAAWQLRDQGQQPGTWPAVMRDTPYISASSASVAVLDYPGVALFKADWPRALVTSLCATGLGCGAPYPRRTGAGAPAPGAGDG